MIVENMKPEDNVLDFIGNVGIVMTDGETEKQYIIRDGETFNHNLLERMIDTRVKTVTGIAPTAVKGTSILIDIASVNNVF